MLYGPGSFLTKDYYYASQFDHHLCGRLSDEQFLANPTNQIHFLRMNTKGEYQKSSDKWAESSKGKFQREISKISLTMATLLEDVCSSQGPHI